MTRSAAPESSAPSRRHAWVDLAKGFCIVAVVGLYARNDLAAIFGQAGWLEPWSAFARPFRMPDFFLLSGLFLSAVIDRPWRSYLDTKVAHYLYFLLIWVAILLVHDLVVLGEGAHGGPLALLKLYVWKLIYPDHMLWFIQTLPVFFVVTRLLRRLPGWLLWGLAAVAMAARVKSGFVPLDNFCAYYVFFLSGHLGAPLIHRLAATAHAHPARSVALIVVWAVLNQLAVSQGLTAIGAVDLLAGFVGIAAIVALSSLLAERAAMRWLAWIGSRSIVVYLGFYIPLTLFTRFAHEHLAGLSIDLLATLAIAIATALPLLAQHATRRSPLRFLFERPQWARGSARPAAASVHTA